MGDRHNQIIIIIKEKKSENFQNSQVVPHVLIQQKCRPQKASAGSDRKLFTAGNVLLCRVTLESPLN